jgi:hypothetical protein
MSNLKLEVYLVCVFHVIFWLYVWFAWALPKPIFHIQFVLLFLLPLAFAVQTLPCHLLIKEKIMRIRQNKADFEKSENPACTSEHFMWDRIANNLNMESSEVHDLMMRMQKCEEALGVTKLFHWLRNKMDGISMMNPFSAHGMIILGYLFNTLAMKFLTGRA